MGTKRFVHVLSLSALALAFAVPAAASADTIKIGSSLTDPWTADALTGGTGTGVQISQGTPTSPLSLTAPADGTITSWSVKAGTMNILYALRVLHPNGGDSFTPTATATAPSVIPATSPDGVVYTYPASVPVQKGDQIGVDENTGGLPTYQSMATLTANDVTGYAGTAVNGTPTSFLTVGGDHYELLLQAEMKVCKVPDVVGKSQPDAGAALAAADSLVNGVVDQLSRSHQQRR